MIFNEILYFDLMYIFFGKNQNLENFELILSMNFINHKEIINLYI